jgi:hypothetical protein
VTPTNDCTAIAGLPDGAPVKIQRKTADSPWTDFDESVAKAARDARSAVRTKIRYRAIPK